MKGIKFFLEIDFLMETEYADGKKRILQAIQMDESKEYLEALVHYEHGCRRLLQGIKLDPSVLSRQKVIGSVRNYVTRAEEIKKNFIGRVKSTNQVSQLSQVVGLQHIKDRLKEAVLLPIVHPQLFDSSRRPWKGILLYGPPGTGKSRCMEALAADIKCSYIQVSASDIVSKHQGDSEKAVKGLFDRARASKPCVLFFDEIDSIGGKRSDDKESSRGVLTELLKQMDGVGTNTEGITVVGATNHPGELDPALRRRFELRLFVPMPGTKARIKILQLHIGDDPATTSLTNQDITNAAENTKGYSGADLAVVANEALMTPVRQCVKSNYFRSVPGDGVSAGQSTGYLLSAFNFIASKFTKLVVPEGDVVVPCESYELGARQINMMDPEFPCSKLRTNPVTAKDLREALEKIKPSVSPTMMQEYKIFSEQYGSAVESFVSDDEEPVVVGVCPCRQTIRIKKKQMIAS